MGLNGKTKGVPNYVGYRIEWEKRAYGKVEGGGAAVGLLVGVGAGQQEALDDL